jgi:hypothetical protein
MGVHLTSDDSIAGKVGAGLSRVGGWFGAGAGRRAGVVRGGRHWMMPVRLLYSPAGAGRGFLTSGGRRLAATKPTLGTKTCPDTGHVHSAPHVCAE